MNDILTPQQIKEGLKDKRLHVVAESTGLSYPTLKKLADGEGANHTIETLQKVSQYISGITVA